jgi:large subunit ribosomal protein L15e
VYSYRTEVETPENLELERLVGWRREKAITRVEKPLRLARARSLGYKAKQGFVIARVRVRRGGLRKSVPSSGRRQRHIGSKRYTPHKSMLLIAQERAAKKFPNLRALNGYWVGEDGQHKWFEIILVDPSHPVIMADKNINWIGSPNQKGRAERGLTSPGKKMRGLQA